MNRLWVAFNEFGDLVADAYSLESLLRRVAARGYDEDEVLIGRWTA